MPATAGNSDEKGSKEHGETGAERREKTMARRVTHYIMF